MPRSQRQRMLVEPLTQLHLDQAGRVVAHHFLKVLQAGAGYDKHGHDDQRPGERLEGGVAAHYFNYNHRGNRQTGHPGGCGQHPHHGGYDDAPAHVHGQGQQPGMQIHGYISSILCIVFIHVGLLRIDRPAFALKNKTDVYVIESGGVAAQRWDHDSHILAH